MNILEDCSGDCQEANEAELGVIEELRQLGGEALHCWAGHKMGQATKDFGKAHGTAAKSGKKNSGGTPPSGRWPFMSKSLDVPGNDADPLATWRESIAEAAQRLCNGPSRILERIMRLAGCRKSYGGIMVLTCLPAPSAP